MGAAVAQAAEEVEDQGLVSMVVLVALVRAVDMVQFTVGKVALAVAAAPPPATAAQADSEAAAEKAQEAAQAAQQSFASTTKEPTMHYALTQNNIVTHILRVPPENIFPPAVASQYVPCTEDVQVGWLWQSGEFVAPPPEPESEHKVPSAVTMRQARLALLGAGLISSIDSAINAMPSPQKEAARIEWEYSQEVQRHNGFVDILGPLLGLTDAQTDALFITAATL